MVFALLLTRSSQKSIVRKTSVGYSTAASPAVMRQPRKPQKRSGCASPRPQCTRDREVHACVRSTQMTTTLRASCVRGRRELGEHLSRGHG